MSTNFPDFLESTKLVADDPPPTDQQAKLHQMILATYQSMINASYPLESQILMIARMIVLVSSQLNLVPLLPKGAPPNEEPDHV